jgi:kanamycin nucleotidyltransferase
MPGGPQAIERARRLELAYEIAERVQRHYGEATVAIGLFGSLARGTDGPYSDIEMHCVVQGTGIDQRLEWSAGAWKAEVDVYSEDVLLEWATEIDEDWPLTHSACTEVLAVCDPTDLFSRLRDAVLSRHDDQFEQTIRDVIVGDLYEWIGKIRNARAAGNDTCLPYLAVELARTGMCLIGLANRHLYAASSTAFEESLRQPGRPKGYDRLCQMVMSGDLTDTSRVADAAESFWSSVEKWADERGMVIEDELDALLDRQSK